MKKLLLMLLSCGMMNALPLASPQAATKSETTQQEDVQAIYSALVKSNDPTYLIASKTVVVASGVARNMPLESCIVLPQTFAQAWTEILAASRASTSNEVFPSDLKLPRPYKLLPAEEVQEFRDDRMQALRAAQREVILGPTSNPKFAGAKDLLEFSAIYFNQSRTLAATFVSSYSSPRAGAWHWTVLEKISDGRWQERPQWARCMAAA